MADFDIRIEDHTGEALKELDSRVEAVLEAWGQQGVSHVKNVITREGRIDTDAMRGSITHQVQKSEDAVYVGTNNEYAPYHEYGTGKYASDGKGRQGWWVYVPGSSNKKSQNPKIYTREQAAQIVARMRAQGLDAHITQGIKPIHMIKNGIGDHVDEFKRIAEDILKR